MEPTKRMREIREAIPWTVVGLYIAVHLATLAWFPFVHSDEAWLASLTRTMIVERSVEATEDFFVLTPRYPHAIKTLFHLMQAPFVAISFSAVSVRLLSLAAGLAALWFLYRIAARLGGSRWYGFAAVVPFAMDVQFLYVSHLARQEIVLVAWMLGAMWTALRTPPHRRAFVAGTIVASAIFIHPNSFIVALAAAPWVVYLGAKNGGIGDDRSAAGQNGIAVAARDLGVYAAILAIGAAVALAASCAMDPQFLRHYGEFGAEVGVGDSALMRLFRLRDFFEKLWAQRAGTYYLPPIRVQLVLLVGVTPIAAAVALLGRGWSVRVGLWRPIASVVAVVVGLYAIGKYSPPSVIFLIPWLYLMVPLLVGTLFSGGAVPPPAAGEGLPTDRGGASTSSADPSLRQEASTPPEEGAPSAVEGASRTTPARIRALRATTLVLTAMVASASIGEIARWWPGGAAGESYGAYLQQVDRAVDGSTHRGGVVDDDTEAAPRIEGDPPAAGGGPRVLANLNTAFAWSPDQLRVYRDLARLPRPEPTENAGASVGPFAAFLATEGITHVVLPVDELGIIYDRRPLWNDVYGNPNRFYPELMEILETRGELVAELDAPVYGVRMLHYQGDLPGRVRVYRLAPATEERTPPR